MQFFFSFQIPKVKIRSSFCAIFKTLAFKHGSKKWSKIIFWHHFQSCVINMNLLPQLWNHFGISAMCCLFRWVLIELSHFNWITIFEKSHWIIRKESGNDFVFSIMRTMKKWGNVQIKLYTKIYQKTKLKSVVIVKTILIEHQFSSCYLNCWVGLFNGQFFW